MTQKELLIRLLKYQIGLRRYEAGQRNEMLRLIDKIEKKFIKSNDMDIITSEYPGLPNFEAFAKLAVDVSMKGFDESPSLSIIERISRPRFEGNFMAEWWSRARNDLLFKVKGIIKQGIIESLDKGQITSRLKGAFDGNRAQAAAVVQTSLHTIANDARQSVYEANEDIIDGYYWLSTLDSRTSILCVSRSGLKWTIDKKPIGHSLPFQTPPIHWNCRSLVMPILSGFDDVKTTRASKLGPIDSNITFDKFLKMLSEKEQDEQLGVGRAQLWRDGKITLKDLLDGKGRELTLDELRDKYA